MTNKLCLIALLVAFVSLGLIYSITTPVFEAPDETWHYNYIRYLAEGHGLPSLLDNEHGAYQEAAQPPLYYAVAALATAPISDDDKSQVIWHNPGFGYHAPGTVNDNKNMLIHTPREGWPWRGFTLALHVARLLSLAFGTLAVLATWGLAREAAPGRPGLALAAAGAVALTPQFVFVSGVASNDSTAAALSTAALWGILNLRRRPTALRAALTGALIGLAWLAKTSTLLLLPLAIISIIQYPIPNLKSLISNSSTTLRASLQALIILTVVTLLVGGWWYARNWMLYGDALGMGAHANTPWGRAHAVSLLAVLPELPRVYRSFWGAFGWGGIEWPDWVYVMLGALPLTLLIGWLLRAARRARPVARGLSPIILLVWCLGILAALLRWMTQIEAPHGRLLFPAIGAWSVLLASAWAMLGQRVGRTVALTSLSGLGLLALASPFTTIQPALMPPPLLTQAQVQAQVEARHKVYGDVAELVGWRLDPTKARPGDVVPLTLCWQALQPMTTDYTVFVHVLGKDNLVVGARDTWPGLGRFPTSLWPPGQPFCDVVRVQIEQWAPAPAVYAVEAGLYDAKSGERLEPQESGLPILGQLIVRGAPPPTPQHMILYNLDDKIKLVGYDLQVSQIQTGQPVSLTLYWQAQTSAQQDYTVFVHALDENGQLAAQNDTPPRDGQFPTSVWEAGEIVADTHTLTLPAGHYTLKVGMYHPPDMVRLAVRGPGGPVQDDAIPLTDIQVPR